jgi:hypothetical protein
LIRRGDGHPAKGDLADGRFGSVDDGHFFRRLGDLTRRASGHGQQRRDHRGEPHHQPTPASPNVMITDRSGGARC